MKYPVRTHTLSALGMMLMSVPYALLAQGVAQGVAQNSLVEQVIVTARKRSEPATAVPMSFNVIDATTIDTFRIRNLADLAPPCTQRCPLRGFPRRWHSYLDYPRRGLAGFQQQQHASRCRPC